MPKSFKYFANLLWSDGSAITIDKPSYLFLAVLPDLCKNVSKSLGVW